MNNNWENRTDLSPSKSIEEMKLDAEKLLIMCEYKFIDGIWKGKYFNAFITERPGMPRANSNIYDNVIIEYKYHLTKF